jgi:WD40 repeat protein
VYVDVCGRIIKIQSSFGWRCLLDQRTPLDYAAEFLRCSRSRAQANTTEAFHLVFHRLLQLLPAKTATSGLFDTTICSICRSYESCGMASPLAEPEAACQDAPSELQPRCIASTGTSFNGQVDTASLQAEAASKYKNNFFKEAQFSADGTAIVTHNDDDGLRTFVLPQDLLEESEHPHELAPYSVLPSPTNVQSYALYPGFSLQDMSTTLILSAPKDLPLRLTNALDSSYSHATYSYIHAKTEAYIAPNSLAFHSDGSHFVAGARGSVAIFDTLRANEGPIAMHITGPKDPMRAATSMRDSGLIMSLSISTDNFLAVGSSNRAVGIFSSAGHGGCQTAFSVAPKLSDPDAATYSGTGITSLAWTPDGSYLLVGERQSDGIHVYDIRNQLRRVSWLAGRNALTPQRLGISTIPTTSGLEVWAGGMDGALRMWQNPGRVEGIQEPDAVFSEMHGDSVSSAVWHPGGAVMATCSGQRRFEDADEDEVLTEPDNSLKIWSV